jgi:hypothetical protein
VTNCLSYDTVSVVTKNGRADLYVCICDTSTAFCLFGSRLMGLLTHCLWFRKSATEDVGGSAHDWWSSLCRLEDGGDNALARFVANMLKCPPCIEVSCCDVDCATDDTAPARTLRTVCSDMILKCFPSSIWLCLQMSRSLRNSRYDA